MSKKMNKTELKKELKKLKIEFEADATNEVLEGLLDKAQATPPAGPADDKDKNESPKPPVNDDNQGSPSPDAGKEAPIEDGGKKKAPDSVEGTGKFVVIAFKDGSRMFNGDGQAVSPVETEPKAVSKLARACARSNALVGARTIKAPVGHEA